ncbi:MAG: hypothetical protein ABSF09_10300 [Candidatus Bathyarchaeia archaeon]|jgi:hypothetical protein
MGVLSELAQDSYSTAIIPGIAHGMERHLRLVVGRATPEDVKAGMEQVEKLHHFEVTATQNSAVQYLSYSPSPKDSQERHWIHNV